MATVAGFDVTVIDPREAFVRSGNLANVTALVEWPDHAPGWLPENRIDVTIEGVGDGPRTIRVHVPQR